MPRHRSQPRKAQTHRANSRDLFEHWPSVRERLQKARQILLFLDFDGTLVEYRAKPHQVRLGARERKALAALAAHKRVRAAIVSGRRRDDLARYASVPGVELFGLYGWDRGKPRQELPARTLAKVSRARTMLAELPAKLPGIFIEDKGVSLAVHFRGVSPQVVRDVHRCVNRMMGALRPELHLLRSSTTWEVAPRQMRGKGVALRELAGRPHDHHLPIYLGDDLTDEPAFAELRHGITVLVGPPRKTKAGYRLGTPAEVLKFLKLLAAAIG